MRAYIVLVAALAASALVSSTFGQTITATNAAKGIETGMKALGESIMHTEDFQKDVDAQTYTQQTFDGLSQLKRVVDAISTAFSSKADVIKGLAAKAEQLANGLEGRTVEGSPSACDGDATTTSACGTFSVVPEFGGPAISTQTGAVKYAWADDDGDGRPTIYVDRNAETTKKHLEVAVGLTDLMKENYEKTPNLKWQYFGSASGFIYSYPASKWIPENFPYDPRLRGWYVDASAGPKDVVLIMDVSGSMTRNNRGTLAKAAAKSILSAVSDSDYINIVTFNSEAKVSSCFPDRLVRASPENVNRITQFIDAISFSGGTSFSAGFNKAFELLQGTRDAGHGTGCNSAMLFLTDGISDDQSDVPALVAEKNTQDIGAKIFTYTLGADADEAAPKAIACAHNGVYTHIPDGGDLRSQMAFYYDYFAAGIDRQNTVSWSRPYLDALGLGILMSGVLPVYDRSLSPPKLVGVMSTDVTMDALLAEVQNFAAKDSYLFLLNAAGEAMAHPRLASSRNTKKLSAPIFVDATDLEGSAFEAVKTKIVAGETGHQTITAQRVLAKGGVLSGASTQSVTVTYFYQPVPDTPFFLVLAFQGSTTTGSSYNLKTLNVPSSFQKPTYYHRLDKYPTNVPLTSSTDSRYKSKYLATDYTTYKASPGSFTDPSDYFTRTETTTTVKALHDWINSGTTPAFSTLPGKGFVSQPPITNHIKLSSLIEPRWVDAMANTIACWRGTGGTNCNTQETTVWIYMAHASGSIIRTYPGGPVQNVEGSFTDYDPAVRGWFKRGLYYRDQVSVSAPYLDAFGAGQVITITRGILEGSRATGTDSTAGLDWVVGMDFTYNDFEDLVVGWAAPSNIDCSKTDVRCMLMDANGFLVTHPTFRGATKEAVYADRFVAELEPDLGTLLINTYDFLKKSTIIHYETESETLVYDADVSKLPVTGTLSGCHTGTYAVVAVPFTNLYLITITNFAAVSACTAARGIDLPSSKQHTPDVCTIEKTAPKPAKPTCPAFSLTEEQITTIRGDAASCSSNPLDDQTTIIVAVAASVGGLIILITAVICIVKRRNRAKFKKQVARQAELGRQPQPPARAPRPANNNAGGAVFTLPQNAAQPRTASGSDTSSSSSYYE